MTTETKTRMPARQTCTDHCVGCGGHFHGLGAFDAHRREQLCRDPESVATQKGVLLLQAWTTDGYCDKDAECWDNGKKLEAKHPVTIYQRAGSGWNGPTDLPRSQDAAQLTLPVSEAREQGVSVKVIADREKGR